MNSTKLYRWTLMIAVGILSSQVAPSGVFAAIDAVPPCRNDVAAACSQNAVKSVEPSACNWNIIVPLMEQCIYEAINGCPTYQIERWRTVISDFNASLYSSTCATLCPNPDRSAASMEQCFGVTDTVTTLQLTTLADLVAYILTLSPGANKPACSLLGSAIDCLNVATVGCSGLMDLANARLDAMNATLAINACNVSRFVTPTTSEPLAIFNSVSIPLKTTTEAMEALPAVLLEGGSGKSTVWIVLIVLAGVTFVAILIIVFVLLQRTFTYRREAKRQSRQSMGSRPEWRFLSSKEIVPDELEQISSPRPFSQRLRGTTDLYYRAT